MALTQSRPVTTGELINGTFRGIAEIKRPLAMYFGFFFAASLIGSFSSALGSLATIPLFLAYFGGQYYLYREMLRAAGISYDTHFKMFSFLFMGLVLGLALYISMFFLFVPAILLGSKWVMAPTFLVSEEMNLFEAIGASWRASAGNLAPIALAYTIIWFIWFALITASSVFSGGFETMLDSLAGISRSSLGSAVSSITMHALPVMLMGLSVTCYRTLKDPAESLVAIFE